MPSPARRLSPLAAAALLAAGTLLLFALSFRTWFQGCQTFEFCHYAEIGTNLLQGRGFTSLAHEPAGLAELAAAGVPWERGGPAVGRFVLYALWCALWLAVGGGGDFGMALANGAAHALWVAGIYLGGRRLASPRAALAAAAAWALHPELLAGYDLLGHPDLLFGLLFGALNLLLWESLEREGPRRRWLGLGLLAGACWLCRYSFSIWLPFYLGLPLALRGRRGAAPAALFLAGFLVLAGPWRLHQFRLFGSASSPHLLWNLALGVSGDGLPWMEYRLWSLGDLFGPGSLGRLALKAYSNLNSLLQDAPGFFGLALLLPFSALGAAESRGRAGALAAWLAALAAWEAAVFSFLRYESLGWLRGRYFLWLGPFLLLYAAAAVERRGSRRAWRAAAWGAVLLTAQAWAARYASLRTRPDHPSGRPVADWPELEYLRRKTPEDARVATNLPTAVAWYARRPAVHIPNDPADLAVLESRWPVRYLLLSSHRLGELQGYPRWAALLTGRSGNPREAFGRLGWEVEEVFEAALLLRRAGAAAPPPGA